MEPEHPELSIVRQCELLGLARSTFYCSPAWESEENLRLLRQLDELYLERPFFGSRRMAVVDDIKEGDVVSRIGVVSSR